MFIFLAATALLQTGDAMARDISVNSEPAPLTQTREISPDQPISKAAATVFTGTGEILVDKNYPHLKQYLTKTGYLTAEAEFKALRTGPVSASGSLKSVYAFQFTDLGNCGSIGCTQIIVTESGEGLFTLYDEFVGGDLTLASALTNDVHDLTAKTRNGVLVGRFNGTKYTWSLSEKPALAKPSLPEDRFPMESTGECREDRAWHSYRISENEAAAGFGYCRTNRDGNLLLFTCVKDDPQVRVSMKMSTRDLDDGNPVEVRLGVAGQTHTLPGTAYYDVMSGFVLPELLPVELGSSLFDTLAKPAKSLSLSIDDRQKSLHLEGAAAAFKSMIETCR